MRALRGRVAISLAVSLFACSRRPASSDGGAGQDAAPAIVTYEVQELIGIMRGPTPLPMGTRVRVHGLADEHARFGYDTSHTRLDVFPLPKPDSGYTYVLCLGPTRREQALDAVAGREVVVRGALAMFGDFPMLKSCAVATEP